VDPLPSIKIDDITRDGAACAHSRARADRMTPMQCNVSERRGGRS
jgi:hypothetical protein